MYFCFFVMVQRELENSDLKISWNSLKKEALRATILLGFFRHKQESLNNGWEG